MIDRYKQERETMVNEQLILRGIHDRLVLEAMSIIPRERFVPPEMRNMAYNDSPLPIGNDQTISQPYIVALMSEELGLSGNEKVLEIGTGSGYQTSILSHLSREVYTIERIEYLYRAAKHLLTIELGYMNIFFRLSDGSLGWAEHQPYDAIIVTAGAEVIPAPLKNQLAEGGRLVIPVGNRFSQELIKVTKKGKNLIRKDISGVRFVPLIRGSDNRREYQT